MGIFAYIYDTGENPTLDFKILRQQNILLITSYIVIIVSFIIIITGVVSILQNKK